MNKHTARSLVAVAVAVTFAVTSVASAHATPKSVSKNTYRVEGLPQYLTGDVIFKVSVVRGKNTICSITYGAHTDTEAPFEGAISPSIIASHGLAVSIKLCNQKTETLNLTTGTPYYVSSTRVVNNGASQPVTITNSTNKDATAIVYPYMASSSLAPVVIPANSSTKVSIPTGGVSGDLYDTYSTIAVFNKNGTRQHFVIKAGPGWTRLALGNEPIFTPCSVVTWSYDDTGNTDPNMAADVSEGLSLLAKETGLTFTRVSNPSSAQVRFRWESLTSEWGSGRIAVGAPGYGVVFNTNAPYMADARRSGTATGGKAWMVAHEVMHVLGFHHTSHPDELMNPNVHMFSGFGEGDLEGIRTLYPPNGCGK